MARESSLRVHVLFFAIVFVFLFNQAALFAQDYKEILQITANNLRWREIGPAIMGGRIDDFAVVESNPFIFYVGTASGGVWKTTNNGVTFTPIFDDQATSTIGDVAIAPSSPDIVWVGTGEANNRQSSSWGNGVYKSLDGGKTWQHMGLENTQTIGRIIIDYTDPDVVYVAATGHLWGPNEERGVYKTTDGGKTWQKVLYIDVNTGCTDIAIDHENNNTLYAAMYQRRRSVWGFIGSGPGSGLYKTLDGGKSWKRLKEGLPGGHNGRIGIDVYRKNPSIVYAAIENKQGGIFRSEDKGETWTKMSDTNPRPMYYSQIRIDPNNDLILWVHGASMETSYDGGRTFSSRVVSRIHGDHHAMWINLDNSNHMLLGSDGGIHITYDRGLTWDFVNTVAIGQFYEVGFDMKVPYNVYGGLQDNGSWGGPSATRHSIGITNDDWFRVGGGDGFYTQIDPEDDTILYVESQNGALNRLNLYTEENKSIRPQVEGLDERFRFNWNTPVLISPHKHTTIYVGGNRLFKSTDRGDTWTASDDLTKQVDRSKLQLMGMMPDTNALSLHDGISYFGDILTISESPLKEGLLWVGTDDGNIQVSQDGGATWTNVAVNLPNIPEYTSVTRVIASHHVEGRAYVTLDGHQNDDFTPYVFVTENYGKKWRSIAGNVPVYHTVSVIREHPRNENLLFIGTERGAYFSADRGEYWCRFGGNLPMVPVDDIAIHPRENDLIFATHGRSVWILDDITPLQELNQEVLKARSYLFSMRAAERTQRYGHKGSTGHKVFIGPNPPAGAMITYFLNFHPTENDRISLTILDEKGENVSMVRATRDRGFNRVTWNLRHSLSGGEGGGRFAAGGGRASAGGRPAAAGTQRPGGTGGQQPNAAQMAEAAAMAGERFQAGSGPYVVPGVYTVRLTVNGESMTRTIQVDMDPRFDISQQDLIAIRDAGLKVGELSSRARNMSQQITTVTARIDGLKEYLQSINFEDTTLTAEIDAFTDKLGQISSKIGGTRGGRGGFGGAAGESVTRDISALSGIGRINEAPTAKQLELLESMPAKLDALQRELDEFLDVEIPKLNKSINARDIPFLMMRRERGRPGGRPGEGATAEVTGKWSR